MIRIGSRRTLPTSVLAAALVATFLVSIEGVSEARLTAPSLSTAASAGVRESSAERRSLPELAHERICHISRHPRDGMPASEHACPLVVASGAGSSAPAALARASD
jgi:hypothetical protein